MTPNHAHPMTSAELRTALARRPAPPMSPWVARALAGTLPPSRPLPLVCWPAGAPRNFDRYARHEPKP